MPIQCPKCRKYMIPTDISGIQIDYCKMGCKSIWLDEGEGQAVKEKSSWHLGLIKVLHHYRQKNINDILDEEKKPCPTCKEFLEQLEMPPGSDLYLDYCNECKGIFFDKGELKRYLHFLKEQDNFESLNLQYPYTLREECNTLTDILMRIYWLAGMFR